MIVWRTEECIHPSLLHDNIKSTNFSYNKLNIFNQIYILLIESFKYVETQRYNFFQYTLEKLLLFSVNKITLQFVEFAVNT